MKAKLREEKKKKRFQFEMKRKGDWELIFPSADDKRNIEYENMLRTANDLWDEFTTGKGKRESMADKRSQGSKMQYHKNHGMSKGFNQSNANLRGN